MAQGYQRRRNRAYGAARQILELRRLVRDLIALSAMPAMWKDYEPGRIADSAASALASMIGANFVYVGLPGRAPSH